MPECSSQIHAKRVTTACTFCSIKKKECKPPPSWAVDIRQILDGHGALLLELPRISALIVASVGISDGVPCSLRARGRC
jgi:hypothetical protein